MDYKLINEMSEDIEVFAKYLNIELNYFQKEIIQNLKTNNRINFKLPRQSGGSTIIALLATHNALFNREKMIAIVCPKLIQSYEIKIKCVELLNNFSRLFNIEKNNI